MQRIILSVFLIVGLLMNKNLSAQQKSKWDLGSCIEYALNQNIDIRKAGLSNQSLEYQYEQNKALRFPSVNASAGQNFNWSKDVTEGSGLKGENSSNLAVNSSVLIFNSSRLINQIKQSEKNIESGKLGLESTKESISLNILNAFLQILYAEEQVKNSEKQIESTSQQVNLAQERLTLQVISQSDFLQVKSQLASEKLTLANAKSQLATAKVTLMQLMELKVTDDFEITHPNLDSMLNQRLAPNAQSVFEKSVQIKPQIKKSAIDKEIAALDEKIARAGYFPKVSANLGLSSMYATQNSTAYFNQIENSFSPTLSISLAIPIYQQKQIKTNIAMAQINFSNAELTEINTRNQLRKNIEQACQDVISAQVEYEASIENYNTNKESSILSDEKFVQGLINSVDYLVSKTTVIVSESKLLQSKYNLIFNYKILDFYLGIPLSL